MGSNIIQHLRERTAKILEEALHEETASRAVGAWRR